MILLSFIIFVILILFSSSLNLIETFKSKKKNCFVVISKNVSDNLYNAYSDVIKNDLFFISDRKPKVNHDNIIHYDSNLMRKKGFTNMHSSITVTSWDKVFYFLDNSDILQNYEYVWIIEDDCYLNKNLFSNFIERFDKNKEDFIVFGWYKKNKKEWNAWRFNRKTEKTQFFKNENLRASINQFCRMSPKLIKETLKLRSIHNKFCFHELQFASIVKEKNLSFLKDKNNDIFISAFKTANSRKTNEQLKDENITVVHPKKNWFNF